MTVRCAWCHSPIHPPAGTPRGRAAAGRSDGICRPCVHRQLAALARPALPSRASLAAPHALR